MNNGRMTFRFDEDRDKYKPKAEPEEQWVGSISMDTAPQDPGESSRQEARYPERTWTYIEKSNSPLTKSLENHNEEWYGRPQLGEDRKLKYSGKTLHSVPDPRDFENTSQSELDPRYLENTSQSELDRRYLENTSQSELDPRYFENTSQSELDPRYFENLSHSELEYGGSFYSRRPSHWWKFAGIIVGAIATGLLLGYGALSLFNGGDTGDSNVVVRTDTTSLQDETLGTTSEWAGLGTSGLPLTDPDSSNVDVIHIPVQIEGQSYYMLQYGVFSTPAGAEQAQQELLTAGLAASIDPTDGNRVYAGISPDREQAKLLSNGLKSQGIELYVREVTLPAVEQLAFEGTAETVSNYFNVSGRILAELSTSSAAMLSNGTGTQVVADISDLHLEWTEAVKALESGVSGEALGIITELKLSISQCMSALNEYNKNKSDGLLWEIQGSIMNGLNQQKRLLAALS